MSKIDKAFDALKGNGLFLGIQHRSECRYNTKRWTGVPINECPCDCYMRHFFAAGWLAARGTKGE